MDISFDTTQLDSVFSSLAHPKRRGMITTLAFRPATITQLAKEYDLSLPAIHKHLRLLETAKLIRRQKAGRTNFIALNPGSLGLAQNWLNQFHTEWGSSAETLENYIASLRE